MRLQDASLDLHERQAAAARLVQLAVDANVAGSIATILTPDAVKRDPQAATLILEAIEAAAAPSPLIGPVLVSAAPSLPPELRPFLYGALSRFSSQEAVGVLITAAHGAETPEQRAPIIQALVRISGRDDLGASADDWTTWFDSLKWVNELEWHRELSRGLAAQRNRLQASKALIVTRLVELTRTTYLTLEPGPDRSARLAALLADSEPAMRQLGFDLARRELLAAAGAINGEVGKAAVALLTSPDPGVRAQAASLVVQLAPPDAEDAVMLALSRERSPSAAAALLGGVVKWPSQSAAAPVLSWLQRADETVRPAAAVAALALARLGHFSQDQADALLASIRARESIIAPEAKILVIAGDDADRQRVSAMLRSDDPAQRRMAAEALVNRTDAVDAVVDAARLDAALYRLAADMLTRHRPTLDGYRTLTSLTAPDERTRDEFVARMALRLPMADVHTVALEYEDPSDRIVLLLPRLEQPLPEEPALRQGALDCLLLYAQSELALAHPARALVVLERIRAEPVSDQAALNSALAVALLGTGQVEAGASISADPADWIRALEISVGAEHAQTLLERIRETFPDQLDAEQQATIAALAKAIDESDEISEADGDG